MGQMPGDKAGQVSAVLQFKLIRLTWHSDALRRHAAFAAHP
jgi:hypothetical protein